MKSKDSLRIQDGWLLKKSHGILFCGDNGVQVYFHGVNYSTSCAPRNTAYQVFGVIHISKRWLQAGFSLAHFAHEYGHYLQQRDLGLFRYFYQVALPSLFSVVTSPALHSFKSFEVDATSRGNHYLALHSQFTPQQADSHVLV